MKNMTDVLKEMYPIDRLGRIKEPVLVWMYGILQPHPDLEDETTWYQEKGKNWLVKTRAEAEAKELIANGWVSRTLVYVDRSKLDGYELAKDEDLWWKR